MVSHWAVGWRGPDHPGIRAEAPDRLPECVVRTVTENCKTLKFRDSGFEES